MSRSIKDYLFLALKGTAMGVANIMPGVSGGTIAFICGIYEELIESIKFLNFRNLKGLFKNGPKYFWKAINGSFLLVLVTGILGSLFLLAKFLNFLLLKIPIPMWAFFFGLISASAIYLALKNNSWNYKSIIACFLGIGIAFIVTIFSPVANSKDPALWYIFLCGALAICAIILPRISGSLILLLMGEYQFVLSAVDNLKMTFLYIFGLGTIFGLISFTNALSWLLRKYFNTTVAFLVGLMIGSLNKVWPWKQTLLSHTNQFAQIIPDKQENVLPFSFYELTGKDPQLLYAILMAITGFLVIFLIESAYTKAKIANETI
jgi:putative membrane protein